MKKEENNILMGALIGIIVIILVVGGYFLFVKKDSSNNILYHIVEGETFDIYGAEYDSNHNKQFVKRDKKVSFSYPQIDIASDEVTKINNEIEKKYKEVYDDDNSDSKVNYQYGCVAIKKNGEYYSASHIRSISYKIDETSDYISVVLFDNYYTECAGGYTFYYGYVINKNTEKVITNQELVKMFNCDEKEIVDKYNANADTFGYTKVESIEEIGNKLFIYNGYLSLATRGNGESLSKYNGTEFVPYYYNELVK